MNDVGYSEVIVSLYAEKDGEPETIPYTWRERLLSWPWRPWVASYTRIPRVPCGYTLANGTMVVHPAIYEELRKVPHA